MSDPSPPSKHADTLRECRAQYLEQLSHILLAGEPFPPAAIAAFQAGVGRHFDQMCARKPLNTLYQADESTATSLALIGEYDLEQSIHLTELGRKLLDATSNELWHLNLRFLTLLHRPELASNDNPLGPQGIVAGLTELFSVLPESHEKKLGRIERLQKFLPAQLAALYRKLDKFLVDRHVGTSRSRLGTRLPGGKPAATDNPVAALQKTLLGPARHYKTQRADSAGKLFTQATLERLLTRLETMEQSAPCQESVPWLPEASEPELTNRPPLAENPPPALNRSGLGIPDGAPEAAAIDALDLIFARICTSPDLPEAIRSTLLSLHIPTLKAAMLDSSFFTDDAHPARQLLDKMAQAALGLPLDVSSEHPLCARLREIANALRSDFRRDIALFAQQAGKVDALIAQRARLAAQLIPHYQPLLAEFERQNQARLRCQQCIENLLAANDTPESIALFLRQSWQTLLHSAWLSSGESGKEWKEYLAAAEQLLWSIQPKTSIDERKQLTRILPDLLKALGKGMAQIKLPDTAQSAFLDTCYDLQTQALLCNKNPATSTQPITPPADSAAEQLLFAELHSGEWLLKTCQMLPPRRPADDSANNPLPIGVWLEFLFNDQRLCGRLGQISAGSGYLLFTHPDWPFAVTLPAAMLSEQLEQQQAAIVSERSLFNSAAEKALHDTPKSDVLA